MTVYERGGEEVYDHGTLYRRRSRASYAIEVMQTARIGRVAHATAGVGAAA